MLVESAARLFHNVRNGWVNQPPALFVDLGALAKRTKFCGARSNCVTFFAYIYKTNFNHYPQPPLMLAWLMTAVRGASSQLPNFLFTDGFPSVPHYNRQRHIALCDPVLHLTDGFRRARPIKEGDHPKCSDNATCVLLILPVIKVMPCRQRRLFKQFEGGYTGAIHRRDHTC